MKALILLLFFLVQPLGLSSEFSSSSVADVTGLLGYWHSTNPIDKASADVYRETWVKIVNVGSSGYYINKVTITISGFKLITESDMGGNLRYSFYEGSNLIDSGSLSVGQKVEKTYKTAKYYVEYSGIGSLNLPDYVAKLNVSNYGNIVVYPTEAEFSNFPNAQELGARFDNSYSSLPRYKLNGAEMADPDGVVKYRSSPNENGAIKLELDHLSDWRVEGNTAYFDFYKNFGISIVQAYAKTSHGVLFEKSYPPYTPPPASPPEFSVPYLYLILILVAVAAGVVIISREG